MSKSNDKILIDTINYLKYFNEHLNYKIYKSEVNYPEDNNTEKIDDEVFYSEIAEGKIKKFETEEGKIYEKNISEDSNSDVSENWMSSKTLESFEKEIKNCTKCKLLARTRKQIVFGTGAPDAKVVVVGEAPGADEDEQGKPFVGRAGKLLTDILKAINFTRDEVFICNILKCRPPENRNPLPDEIANCEPYLFKQLEMIKPKLILALGTFAAQTLLQTKEPLGKLRGKFHLYKGIKMMVTYHPAALLRNPNWKRPTWEDVQLFRKEYDLIKVK